MVIFANAKPPPEYWINFTKPPINPSKIRILALYVSATSGTK
jgi:hypothetical protein